MVENWLGMVFIASSDFYDLINQIGQRVDEPVGQTVRKRVSLNQSLVTIGDSSSDQVKVVSPAEKRS